MLLIKKIHVYGVVFEICQILRYVRATAIYSLEAYSTYENENTPIDELYPKHSEALRKSHVAPKALPTLGTLLNTREARLRDKDILDEKRKEGMYEEKVPPDLFLHRGQ